MFVYLCLLHASLLRARSDAPFSKTAPASFGQFWQFLKTVAENLAGAVFENGASDRALSILTRRNASQGDYVSSHPGRIKNPVSAVRLAKVLPNVLSQMVWKLFTATQALGLRKDYAYAVMFPSDSQVHQTAVAWLGTIGFGFLYLCRIYFL